MRDAATGKAIGEPIRHERYQTGLAVYSAQFSADGQRVVTASVDGTARIWDVPTTRSQDTRDDVLLLADLAEATGGFALKASGQTETLITQTPEQVKATREKIAAEFEGQSSELTPIERLLKWSVSDSRHRTISPFSKVTVPEWIENRITEGTLDGLRAAVQLEPDNALLAAHFGKALAVHAREPDSMADLDEARLARKVRRAQAEADFQTRRALKLAPDNEEVKNLRVEVVKLLQLPE
jgi:hypothetical protein